MATSGFSSNPGLGHQPAQESSLHRPDGRQTTENSRARTGHTGLNTVVETVPTCPGRFYLQLPDGRVRPMKVCDMNGQLYAISSLGFIATPVEDVAGRWLTPVEKG